MNNLNQRRLPEVLLALGIILALALVVTTSNANAQTNNPASGAPTISGIAEVGQTLMASTSGISDADGLDNVSYNYQWLADDTEIDGATISTYELQSSDAGKVIKVRVTFTDDDNNAESLTSEGTVAVNNPATGTPTFIGPLRVGGVLRIDTSSIEDLDGLTDPGFSYTWLAADDLMELGAFLRALGRIKEYEIPPYDAGMTIKVQMYFDDDLGNDEFIEIQATSTVAAAAPDQPGNLSASLGDPGELDLSWSSPAVCDYSVNFDCWLGIDRSFRVETAVPTSQATRSNGSYHPGLECGIRRFGSGGYRYVLHRHRAGREQHVQRARARQERAGLGTPSTEVTVSGTDLNVGPVVSGRAVPYFFETNPRDVATYTATDAESNTITWALSGDDSDFFSISNGVLNFDSGGDFENPQDDGANNAYDVNILASDGQNTATFPVTVVIFDVEDEPPVITGDDALTFAEYMDTTTVLQTYSATDPEGVYTSFTWSLSGD